MKKIISLLFYFFLLLKTGRAQQPTELLLTIADCRNPDRYIGNGADSIKLYNSDSNLVYQAYGIQLSKWPLKIKSLVSGEYKVTYKNQYGRLISEKISLADKNLNALMLCQDKLPAYPQNTLDKLQQGDRIEINIFSRGCFHASEENISITKENNQFIARRYYKPTVMVKEKGKNIYKRADTVTIKIAVLTEPNILAFSRFENELNYVTDRGCTTTDSYTITSKYLNIKKTDGSCEWRGYAYLTTSFFGKEE